MTITIGDIVVLAAPYPVVDDLVVPADSSAANEIQKKLSDSHLVK